MDIDMMCGGFEITVANFSVPEGEVKLIQGYNAPAINTNDRRYEHFQLETQFTPGDHCLVRIRPIRDLNHLLEEEVSVKNE